MGRRGIPSVEVRDASIRILFTVPGQGRRRRTLTLHGKPLPPTAANIAAAHRLADEIGAKIKFGTFVEAEMFPDAGPGSVIDVGQQLDTWIGAQRIEASTRAGYESAIRFWKAVIGDKPLRGLLLSDILTGIAKRPSLSGKTVNNYVSVLREALDLAVADRLLTHNPAAEVKRAKHQKEPPDPFDRGEVADIIADIQKHAPPAVANLVRFWFWTGLRTSEIAGLQWGAIDWRRKTATIAEVMVRGEEKSRTKTNKARQVILNSEALAALTAQKEHTFLAGKHVFLDPRYGAPWTEERAFRRSYWTPSLKRLGIRYRRPYNMRHSYATAMLMAGMNPAFCAGQLGHSVEMFLTTYARWIGGDRDALEMGRLEAVLSPSCPQEKKKAP